MKTLISIIVIMFAAGCSNEGFMGMARRSNEARRLLAEEKKTIVGTYEAKKDKNGNASKLVFLENGKWERYLIVGGIPRVFEKDSEGTWELVQHQIHAGSPKPYYGNWQVYSIVRNGVRIPLTLIATVEDGKRTDLPKEKQVWTWKKLKE